MYCYGLPRPGDPDGCLVSALSQASRSVDRFADTTVHGLIRAVFHFLSAVSHCNERRTSNDCNGRNPRGQGTWVGRGVSATRKLDLACL